MRLQGTLERRSIDSRLLKGNPLGDPSERDLLVYVPADVPRDTRLPVVMVLAGYAGTNHSIARWDAFSPNVIERFDRLVAAGACPPALLVLPDACNRWGGSQFIDSVATGPYQQYLADEIVPFVDAHYATVAEQSGRAIVGTSSGGFGALRMGLDRPEVFGAIGSIAGDCAFELSILPDLRQAAIAYERAGGVGPFLDAFARDPGRHSFVGMLVAAYAAAYAPDLDAPPLLASLPFDADTAVTIPAQWDRWLAQDPLRRISSDQDAFAKANLVRIEAGNRDEHGLHFGARMIARALQGRGRAVQHEEFDGGHRGTSFRYETVLPALIAACTR